MAKIDREELRALVRQALKDALGPGAGAAAKPAPPPAPVPAAAGGGELARLVRKAVAEGRRAEITVSLRTPDDADRFARHVAEASSDPEVKAAILAAAVRFVPVGPQPSAAASRPASTGPAPAAPPASAYEMTSGVLTEAKLVEVARTHGRITLGAAVVLTPLARDKAREMKIELTRQKP